MSFRNHPEEDLVVTGSSELLALGTYSKPLGSEGGIEEEALKKVCSVMVALHEGYLAKCQDIEIYRNLTAEEQALLSSVEKSATLHTTLAGVLAVDSCVKCLDREEQFIVGNLVRALSTVVSSCQQIGLTHDPSSVPQLSRSMADSLRYFLNTFATLPAVRPRQQEVEKQLEALEGLESGEGGWSGQQRTELLHELQKENDILRVALKEKEAHIKSLQRVGKQERLEEKHTAHSLGLRGGYTERSSSNGSTPELVNQQFLEELGRVKQELSEKSSIIGRMNEEFAAEMEKYNGVFRRLEEENRGLRRYVDLDTAELLEELEAEVEALREDKRRDQMLLGDIQRRIGAERQRGTQRPYERHYHFEGGYYPPTAISRHQPVHHPQYFSPNYSSRHLHPSPPPPLHFHEDSRAPPPQSQTYSNSHHPGKVSRLKQSSRHSNSKSRSRFSRLQEPLPTSQETIPAPSLNLFERVTTQRRY